MLYDTKGSSLNDSPRRADISSSLEDLTASLDVLKMSLDTLEGLLNPLLICSLEDGCDKDSVSPSNISTLRKMIDNEVSKVKSLENQVSKLIENIDL